MIPRLIQLFFLALLPSLVLAETAEQQPARVGRLKHAVLAPCCYTEPVTIHQSEIAVNSPLFVTGSFVTSRRILHPGSRTTLCRCTNIAAENAARALKCCAGCRTPTGIRGARNASLKKSSGCSRRSPPAGANHPGPAGSLEPARGGRSDCHNS